MINKIAKLLGVKTIYHVVYVSPNGSGYTVGDMILTVSPWATEENFSEVRMTVSQVSRLPVDKISITSLTRV